MKSVLLKVRVVKDGKHYIDLYLCWRNDNKLYYFRVQPQFSKDYRFLVAHALEIESLDNIEKYV